MKDVANAEVQVGDFVAYCTPKYSGLRVGKVIKLTPKGVTIELYGTKTINRGSNQIALLPKS